jgi:hypothetical protein
MQTKKDEIIKTLTTSEEILKSTGMYINKPVCKKWMEDFVDEDTGNVVSIERNSVLYDKGTLINPGLTPELLFYFQSNEFTEIEVSNQKREAYEVSTGEKSYLATVQIGKKKKKFLYKSVNIHLAIEGLKDFIELNFNGPYAVISIKQFQISIILDDTLQSLKEATEEEENIEDDKFYQISVAAIFENAFVDYNVTATVKSRSLERALILFESKLKENYKDEKFSVKLEEAKIIKVDYLIDDEFMSAYKE